MVQKVINLFKKKQIIKTQKGFADIEPYIYNKIFEVKKEISATGVNIFKLMFFGLFFNIKNYLGYFATRKKNMWKFIDDLVFIETISENLDDIEEIYHRVNKEARDILSVKLKRANIHVRFREYLFFAILCCIFLYVFFLIFPNDYVKYFVVGFILFTMFLYFVPFFLLSYRSRNYWTMNYYLEKESSRQLEEVKLFDKGVILLIGMLLKTKQIGFNSLEVVYDFIRERKKGEWSRSTIKNMIYNIDHSTYNDDRICLIRRLENIKSSCYKSYKNHSNNSGEISILPTRSDATLIISELRKVKLETELNIFDLRNIFELLISGHLFENPDVKNLSEYYTKSELSNISMIIEKLKTNLFKQFPDKFDLKKDIDCDKKKLFK